VGADTESDPALRQRRAAALGGTGNADLDAIRAKVLAVTDALGDHPVTYCTVFENITDATDGAGRPPHSIEVLCQYPALAATDLAVATAIFQAKAAGIQTYGAGTVVSESVLDSSGGAHMIAFSKPTLVRIYVIANVIKGPNYPTAAPPADGPTLIANALVAYAADKWQPGVSVKDALLYGPVQDACDVADITSIFIGTAPAPGTATNIAIGVRQQATLAFADITVNAS
jgi:hypothetical protein